MTFDPTHLWVTCATLQRDHYDIVPSNASNASKNVDTVTTSLTIRSLTPRWSLTPLLWRSHMWFHSRIIVSRSPENTSKYVCTVTNQNVNNLNWSLNPLLLRSPDTDSTPRITVFKSCGNTSKYVDTVLLFFSKIDQKVNDPKWPWGDHWPHFCCGHPCDYPRIICPNCMEIHQSMWIPWPLKKSHDFK